MTTRKVAVTFYRPPLRPSEALTVGARIEVKPYGEFVNATPISAVITGEVPTRVRVYDLAIDEVVMDSPLNLGALLRGDAILIAPGQMRRTIRRSEK